MHQNHTSAFFQTNETARVTLVGERRSPDEIMHEHFGSDYRVYRRRWCESERFAYRPDLPIHLDVDTNYTCNLRCIMCPLGTRGFPVRYERKFLDFDLYRKALMEGAAGGLCSVRLGLTGEPLLRPDILDFVRLARELKILDIMLITNGLLLTPELSRELIQAGLTRLMVSVDALRPETYRRIRRGGELAAVRQNILTFLDIRESLRLELPLLRVSFVKMSVNASEIEDFRYFWTGRADYISFQEYTNIIGSEETSYFSGARRLAKTFRCPDPWQRMSLFVNGDLFPCCSDFGRLAPVANLNKVSLAEAWLSERAEYYRALHKEGRWSEDQICRRCALNSTGQEESQAR
ncbi:MAG: radical SAM protein [Pseudomonadota bacterium]